MSDLPDEMWFGTIVGQWPIQCWKSETHALAWYAKPAADGYRKHLWKAKVSDPVQFEAVIPKPYLQRKGLTGEGGDASIYYYCPTSGEWEQQPGGGFDVCCNAPVRHIPLPPLADRPLHVMSCDECRGDLDTHGHFPDCTRYRGGP